MLAFPIPSATTLAVASSALLVLWVARNITIRYKRFNENEKYYGSRYALEPEEETETKPRMINAGLKGIRDAQRIVRVPMFYDSPFITFVSLEFALFKTYAISTISSLLLKTGQLSKVENADRRFIDTSLMICAMNLYPLPPLDLEDNDTPEPGDEQITKDWADPRSAIAISRTNFLHRRWKGKISNSDLLYTMSMFVLEPPKFMAKYDWRPMSKLEQEALFSVWYHIGRCMNIEDIPTTRQSLAEWVEAYEQEHMVFKEENRLVANHTVDLLLYSAPKFLHPFGYKIVISLLEERLRKAFGYDDVPGWLKSLSYGTLCVRALVIKYLFAPRGSVPRSLCPADSQDKIISGGARGSFCPAMGVSAPNTDEKDKEVTIKVVDNLPNLVRLEPGWVENAPWYTASATFGSPLWLWEKLFVKPEERRGATRWQNKELRRAREAGGCPAAGFRLEECGPAGLELLGREEVLNEAVKLNGGKNLTGPWAFGVDK